MKAGLQTLQLFLLLFAAVAAFSGCRAKEKVTIHLRPEIGAFICALANDEHDALLNAALAEAASGSRSGNDDFVSLFGQAYRNRHPQRNLASLFSSPLMPSLTPLAGDEEVLDAIKNSVRQALTSTISVLRRRMTFSQGKHISVQAGARMNIMTVSADGIDDPARLKRNLVIRGRFSFLETYPGNDVYQAIGIADSMLSATEAGQKETAGSTDPVSLDALMKKSSGTWGLLRRLMHRSPSGGYDASALVCYVYSRDTASVDSVLRIVQAKHILTDVCFLYGAGLRITSPRSTVMVPLYAVKKPDFSTAPAIVNNNILEAKVDYTEQTGMPSIFVQLDTAGSHAFYELTTASQGRFIAVVFDNRVFMAPLVRDPIAGGRITIDGQLELDEAVAFTNIIRSGFLEMPLSVVE